MKRLLTAMLVLGAPLAQAQTVDLFFAGPNGAEQAAGTVSITQTPYGALLTPDLKGLPAGTHGFH